MTYLFFLIMASILTFILVKAEVAVDIPASRVCKHYADQAVLISEGHKNLAQMRNALFVQCLKEGGQQ